MKSQTKISRLGILGDIAAIVLLALLPGIRGYDNWQVHEYLFLLLVAAWIVYRRISKISN